MCILHRGHESLEGEQHHHCHLAADVSLWGAVACGLLKPLGAVFHLSESVLRHEVTRNDMPSSGIYRGKGGKANCLD